MPTDGDDQASQSWSPFPVQDWSTLPEDPLAARPPEPVPVRDDLIYTEVGNWKPQRGEVLPTAVIVLVLIVMAGLFAVADRGRGTPARGTLRFVPDDGAVSFAQRKVTDKGTTTATTTVTESARLSGAAAITALDWNLGTSAFGSTGGPGLSESQFWRTTTGAYGTPDPVQTTAIYRTDRAVELIAESGPDRGFVYSPALVELPADVRPGSRWSGTGKAGPALGYASQFTATTVDHTCLSVSGSIRYTSTTSAVEVVRTVGRTWCPGRGIVALDESDPGGPVLSIRSVERPAPTTVSSAAATWTWPNPASWTHKHFGSQSNDPQLGAGTMGGSPSGLVPVFTDSGLAVRVLAGSSDLVAFTPKTRINWMSVWRAHPGGSVLALSVFGDVVVATTSRRHVVGYDSSGRRLWTLQLSELAPSAPVRVDDRRIAIVDMSGTVRVVDAASGRLVWQRRLGTDVSVAPAVGDGAVLVIDRSGDLTALETVNGAQRWQASIEGRAMTTNGDSLVVITDQNAQAVDLATGKTRWVHPYTDVFALIRTFAGHTVVASKSATIFLDDSGRRQSVQPATTELTVNRDYLIGWGTDQAFVLDRHLRTVVTWTIPVIGLTDPPRGPAAYRRGVLLFSGNWQFEGWSDEP